MPSAGALLQLYKEGIAPPDEASMVARYDFSDGSGATLTDSSGNGNDGTISNATWAVGTTNFTSGNSLSFDGNTDYVSLPDGLLTDKAAISYEFFFRIAPGQETETRMLLFRSNGSIHDQVYIQASTNKFVADMGSITSRPTIVTDYIFSPNIWYHVVVTYDSAIGTAIERLKVYINGTLDTAAASTGSGNTSNTGTWTTKLGYTTSAAAWNGNMSFVSLHDSAISSGDITTRFTNSIYKTGEYVNDSTWQLVEEITITTASRWQDFQYYLDGDQDGAYKIEGYWAGNTSGIDPGLQMRCNGKLVAANISWVYEVNAATVSASIQTGTTDILGGLDITTARQCIFEWIMEFPETGHTRYGWNKASHKSGGLNRCEEVMQCSVWTTPASSVNIRALGVYGTQVGSINAGTKLRLWKLKHAYEQ